MDLLEPLGRVMIVVLAIFGVLRLDLMAHSGALKLVLQPLYESRMFLAEFGIGVMAPILLLAWPRVRRSPIGLVIGATCCVLGFILYRLNVSITGLERASGTHFTDHLVVGQPFS